MPNYKLPIITGTGLSAGDLLRWSGSAWVNYPDSNYVSLDGLLEDLDTLGAPASDGQFIVATGAGAFAYEKDNVARTSIGLGNVENTQLSTWAGTTNITTLGTIATVGNITIANGGTIGQSGGPLLTFNDTTNKLEITGCNVGIGIINPDTLLELSKTGGGAILKFDYPGIFAMRVGIPAGESYLAFAQSDDLTSNVRMVIKDSNLGIGEIAPETLVELTSAAPYLTLHNSTHQNTSHGRKTRILFKGEQSGGEESTLAKIEAVHAGTGDNENAYLKFFVNSGSDGNSPTEFMRVSPTGHTHIGGTNAKTRLTVEGTLTLKEQASADGDTASYGQDWVKNTTPCQRWYTDDTGIDYQLSGIATEVLNSSVVWNPPDIADGSSATQSITITGAVLGDFVLVSCNVTLQNLTATAYMIGTNAGVIVLVNNTGSAVNLGECMFYVRVLKK